MLVPTNEVPQADDLQLVVKTTEAVGGGARTDQDIAEAIGGYDPRQGRYYRRAAELLGFIRNDPRGNRSILTRAGLRFVKSTGPERGALLAEAVLGLRITQRVISLLEANRGGGVSRRELENFVSTVTATTEAMVKRRTSTIIAWLTRIELIEDNGDRLLIRNLPAGIGTIDYPALDEPLLPKSTQLSEYQSVSKRVKQEMGTITVLVNEAARERASHSHHMLTELVAKKIRAAGGIPRRNKVIDLATSVSDKHYLFEMKSTTPANFHSQVRAAISQLYEYRYLYNMLDSKLVVVVENPVPRDFGWIVNYVVSDRKMLIVWDGDRRTLQFPESIRNELGFLA